MKKINGKRIFVVSLGCAKNWLDTEIMIGSAILENMAITGEKKDADIFLINTCSFIFDARSEAEEVIKEALEWKKKKQSRKVIIAGCLPQRDIKECVKTYPDVDLFLGLNQVANFAELAEKMLIGESEIPKIEKCTYIYDEKTPRLQLTPSVYAYIKIAEGCNHKCAFCAIPQIRGNQRSRPIKSIVKEAKNLIANGVYELVLIAQDTTSYGIDLNDESNLPKLISELDKIKGKFKIRLLYTHPLHFSDAVIEMFVKSKHLLPYVDIPLQHISAPILKAMKRSTNEQKTRELVEKIKKSIPNLTLRSTFIVGFPNESEEDFQSLKKFINEIKFDRLGVFSFSPEVGTSAAKLPNQVPSEIANARRDELMIIQNKISLEKNKKKVGKTFPVIIEGETAKGFYGRTYGDAPEVDNLVHVVLKSKNLEIGDEAIVKITDAKEYDLFGEI